MPRRRSVPPGGRMHAQRRHIAELRRRARRVTAALASAYGSPTHNNKADPLDELIFIILSQMTRHHSYERAFNRLKSEAPEWDCVLSMPMTRLKRLIRDAGLSNQKGPRIKKILRTIRRDFGVLSLDSLRTWTENQAEQYLTHLPGVHLKTAKCVLLYALGHAVLPVDTHVLRVSRRLGFTDVDTIGTRVHSGLESVIPAALRHDYHVNAIAHGRAICIPARPRCSECILRTLCPYPEQRAKGGTISQPLV